jgi:hypothetical protein
MKMLTMIKNMMRLRERELDQCSRLNNKTILKMFKFKASFILDVYQQVVSKKVIFHFVS